MRPLSPDQCWRPASSCMSGRDREGRAVTGHILGLSAYYHDSAACLLSDGRIVAAAQEERVHRQKHDAGFPRQAVRYCLEEGGLPLGDLRYVLFYDKPLV